MKVAFAGTPEFARIALERLLAAGFEVPLVLTQPDRPAGRGMKLTASAVKAHAQCHGLALQQPAGLRLDGRHAAEAAAARAALAAARPDVLVVAAYGLLLPDWVLAMPPRGCLNIHASTPATCCWPSASRSVRPTRPPRCTTGSPRSAGG